MSRMHIWCRRVILATIFLAVGVWVTAYIQQLILARRARALLVDIRALQVKPDAWNDAQRLMSKWGRSGWGAWHSSSAS